MPDEWEIQHHLNPNLADAAGDADQDGFSNLSEYLAGTSPADPSSKLALALQKTGSAQMQLSFAAQAGRAYRFQTRLASTSGWTDLFPVPAGAERAVSLLQSIDPGAAAVFYRIVLDTDRR
jgi:hypothetical protein